MIMSMFISIVSNAQLLSLNPANEYLFGVNLNTNAFMYGINMPILGYGVGTKFQLFKYSDKIQITLFEMKIR